MFWTSEMPKKASGKKADPKTQRPETGPIKKPKEKIEKIPSKPGLIILFCGVIVPLFAMGIELTTHMCARMFFDPFPSVSHIFLVALVPLSNFLIWLSARRDMTESLGALTFASGMAMGVAILYSMMFIPVLPLAMVAVLFFGFGLLPMSPILAIPPIMKSGKYVVHLSKQKNTFYDGEQLKHIGHMIILCTVLAVELPSTLTRLNLNEAANGPKPGQAIEWLRAFGNQEVMLRACYERSGRATDILGSLYEISHPVPIEKVRELFYQVTGKPFNSVPLPESMKAIRQEPFHLVKSGLMSVSEAGMGSLVPSFNNAGEESGDEFDLDPDVAGEAVSGVSRGLALSHQTLSGKVSGENGFAELDYGITFKNTSKCDREVRTKILLPPGAVVSRAFLRTTKGEREASIMGRNLARSRYRSAVLHKKDPLLVSTCGQDRLLVQLWPVSPEQTLSVRLHILAPMQVSSSSMFQLNYPSIEERNFAVEKPLSVLLNSAQTLKYANNRVVYASRDPMMTELTAIGKGQSVKVTFAETQYPKPENLTIVVDGSVGMKDSMPQILSALRNLPDLKQLKLYYVRDGLMAEPLVMASTIGGNIDGLIQKVQSLQPAGGQVDLPVLDKALAESSEDGKSAVLWVHAAQPVKGHLSSANAKRLGEFNQPFLYDMAVVSGPNEVLDGVYGSPALVRVARAGDAGSDLTALFKNWKLSGGGSQSPGITFAVSPSTEIPGQTAKDMVWSQLAAADEICKIEKNHHGHSCKYGQQAVQLATNYHLVTPFSSALIAEPIRPVIKPAAIPLAMPHANASSVAQMAAMPAPMSTPRSDNLQDFLKPKGEGNASGGSASRYSFARSAYSKEAKASQEESSLDGELDSSAPAVPTNLANNNMSLPNPFAPTPTVPESDTYLLLGVGMLVLGFAYKKRGMLRKSRA